MEKIDLYRCNYMCRLCLTSIDLLSDIIDTKNLLPEKIKELTGIDVRHNLTFLIFFFLI